MLSTRIITAAGCIDTRTFAAALPSLSVATNLHHGENLYDLAAALEQDLCGALAGLTRHSEFILISQIAAESGFDLIYSGKHHYAETFLDHQLKGKGKVVEELARKFGSGETYWAVEMANYLPDIIQSQGTAVHKQVHLKTGRPADSPGYLTSWAFKRA